MPKRVGYLYDRIVSWENMYNALLKAAKRKKRKQETSEWLFNRERYLLELQQELVEQSYVPNPYKYFMIYEPKERMISVASFRDRVVHHSLVAIIEPFFEQIFINNSYATRKGKGLHKAVRRVQLYSREAQWYLKLDIKKYFDSIDHNILLTLIKRKIKDEKVIWLCSVILQNQTESANLNQSCGLPIGNLTSQFFANVYLTSLDYYVTQQLGFQRYVRYMDDLIIISDGKDKLQQALPLIESFLKEHLSLKIKEKSVQLNRVRIGIPFLGYRVFPGLLRLNPVNLKRCISNLHKTEKDYLKGIISDQQMYQSTVSRLGFVGFADSQELMKSLWGRNHQAVPTV